MQQFEHSSKGKTFSKPYQVIVVENLRLNHSLNNITMAVNKALKKRLLEKQKKLKERASGSRWRTIKEGTLRARPLPVVEGQDWSIEVQLSPFNKDVNFISPSTFGMPCAWKEMYDRLANSKDEADRKFAKTKMQLRKKVLMPHLFFKDIKGEEEDGSGLLQLTPNQVVELIDLYCDEDEAGDFTDPDTGYDIKYSRTGSGKNDTEYSQRPCKSTKLPKKYRKPIDLEQMIKDMLPSYKETKRMVEAFLNTRNDDEPDEQDEAPRKKKKKKKNRDLE
jgi:hypothetical protein